MNDLTDLRPDGTVLNDDRGFVLPMDEYLKSCHVVFTRAETVFCYPPESFAKKLKRFFGVKPKGSPFVKLEDVRK